MMKSIYVVFLVIIAGLTAIYVGHTSLDESYFTKSHKQPSAPMGEVPMTEERMAVVARIDGLEVAALEKVMEEAQGAVAITYDDLPPLPGLGEFKDQLISLAGTADPALLKSYVTGIYFFADRDHRQALRHFR
jgi:hypothetical protein